MVTAWRDRLVAFDGFGHLAPHRLRVRHGASRTFDDEVEGRRMLQRALYAREAMLEECKKVTRESLTDWAFGKDFAFMLQLVLSAVCSCMNQLCVTHVAQEYNGTRNIFLCGVKFFVRGQSQDHNQDEEDLKWSQRRVPQDEELDFNEEQDRENLRIRVCWDCKNPSSDEADDTAASFNAFWRLAPGELARLGGPDVQGFVVTVWRGKQTLSLARSMAFGLGICTDVIHQPAVDEEALKGEAAPAVAEEPITLPLRLGSPSLFPQALIGRWVRGLTVLHVREGFICEELDQTFTLQVFPEIIYPPWGEWVLNVSRSSPLVLEWAQQIDAGGIRSNRVIRWIRPWLLQGRLYADSAGTAEVNGSYIPDFTGSSVRYAKVEPGKQVVELRHLNESWAFVSVGEGPEEIFYAAPAAELLGEWDAERAPHKGSGSKNPCGSL
eukprot:s984_g5.t1